MHDENFTKERSFVIMETDTQAALIEDFQPTTGIKAIILPSESGGR